MLKKPYRIRSRKDFNRLYRAGRTAGSKNFSIKSAPNRKATSRGAVIVSKKVAKSAVKRNRMRRRVYAQLRAHWPKLTGGFDIAVIIHKDIGALKPAELKLQLAKLLNDLKLIK